MISATSPLVLGSQSPRRAEILRGLGLPFVIQRVETDESVRACERAEDYVKRVALTKLEAVAERLSGAEPQLSWEVVLTADTTVVVDEDILGKPESTEDACRLLRRIAGRTHRVLTSYAIGTPGAPGHVARIRTVASLVTMREATDGELRRYAQTGEGLDKAGAYAVQGIGAFLVERIDGSYTNVVGLPACELIVDLTELGLLGPFPSVPAVV